MATKFNQIFLISFLGFCAAWMEWNSFGSADFSELTWFVAVVILAIIIGTAYYKKRLLQPQMWIVTGLLCWSFWRFLTWIFVSRTGLIIGLVGILTFPIQEILEINTTELIVLTLTVIIILASVWGLYWIYKNFDIDWLKKSLVYWFLLLTVIGIVGIYSGQQPFKDNCFGLNAYSSSLFCKLQDNLGVMGSILVTLTFIVWILSFALQQAKSYGVLATSWIIVFTPVWIEIFFNPSRILSVLLFKEIRTAGESIPVGILEANMQLLNLLPIVIFFVLIPVGLILLNTEKLRIWWIISTSTIAFTIMLVVLFRSLDIGRTLFSYSNGEQIIFVLMALQLWLPLILGIILSNQPNTQKLTMAAENR